MERRKSELLADVVRRFMRESGLETPLNQYRLLQLWPDVVGNAVAEATGQLYIKNQSLYVHILTPVLRTELQMQRAALVKALNEKVGAMVIVDVIFI